MYWACLQIQIHQNDVCWEYKSLSRYLPNKIDDSIKFSIQNHKNKAYHLHAQTPKAEVVAYIAENVEVHKVNTQIQ